MDIDKVDMKDPAIIAAIKGVLDKQGKEKAAEEDLESKAKNAIDAGTRFISVIDKSTEVISAELTKMKEARQTFLISDHELFDSLNDEFNVMKPAIKSANGKNFKLGLLAENWFVRCTFITDLLLIYSKLIYRDDQYKRMAEVEPRDGFKKPLGGVVAIKENGTNGELRAMLRLPRYIGKTKWTTIKFVRKLMSLLYAALKMYLFFFWYAFNKKKLINNKRNSILL